MTVRVNKPSFNIREKLSELGRKFGLKGSELAAAETVQEARDLVSAGRRNVIINGKILGLTESEIKSKFLSIQNFAEIGDFFYQPSEYLLQRHGIETRLCSSSTC